MKRQPRYSKGQRIGGRFLVHQALMGGMGEVYLCLDEESMLPFALKTFQGSSTALADIFKKEVASWIALEKHPNIVRCFWLQRFDNIPFMALEWVASDETKGTDLRSWLRRGPLDLPLALRFTIDIVRGLIHANEKSPGIVHRDLKPDNVLVNQSRQAKITDFGLATVATVAKLDAENLAEINLGQSRYVGNIVGTPAYMPPEQWRGDADIDFRADLYAVGCILYELLTGQWLYNGRTIGELRAQHLEAPLPILNSTLPADLNPILEGCLAKRREDRFDRLELLVADLIRLYEAHSNEPLPDARDMSFEAIDYINRSATYGYLGQYERAIADSDEAIRLDPGYAPSYANRGAGYASLGQYERAIADYSEAIRLDPNYAPAYLNRGNSYEKLGQYERAIADCDEAIRLDPDFVLAYNNRGTFFAALAQHERAIADYERSIRLDPSYALAYNNRGNSHMAMDQYDQAIADYDNAIHLDPNDALAYYNRGLAYRSLGQNECAIKDYDAAIRLDPNDAQYYLDRGLLYAALGKYDMAIADYSSAIRIDPAFASAYYNRGNSYAAMEKRNLAIADYDEAIRLDPGFVKAYNNRAASYAILSQFERAIVDWDEAIRLDPTLAQAYYNRGNSYANMGHSERAIADYDEVLRLDPAYASAYFNKGSILADMGRLQESLSLFEKAYALGNQDAVGAIQQVRQMLDLSHLMMPAKPHELQAAFEAFQRASSLDAMRQIVGQFPILKQMIPMIEQVIAQQVQPEQRPYFEQRLAWLRQIVEGK